MKRKLMALICSCILLSGCRLGSEPPVQTEPLVTEKPTTQTEPTVSTLPLLEQGIALEESSNLLHIPNAAVEGMEQPELRQLGNGLLLSEYMDQKMVLNHISMENGALITSAAIPAGADTKLYIGNGEIALCDRESGLITILDENLRTIRTYPMTAEGDDWYMNSELDTLYIFFADRGLVARNLETGAENWLVENGFQVTAIGGSGYYLIVQYTDRADQKTYFRCLNLSNATLETLPVNGIVSDGTRQGENWLLQIGDAHLLVQGEEVRTPVLEDGTIRLLSPRRHLLVMDPSRRDLTLFDTDGAFISECSLPQNAQAMIGSDFVWSGYWEGYFFTDFFGSSCRLMFWDVNAEKEGENLEIVPLGAAVETQPVVERQLYERAEKLSERYGLDIRIAEKCDAAYTHYTASVMTNPQYIRSALDTLEKALSKYPEGFFRQLCYGSIESVRIELVDALTSKPDADNQPDAAAGIAQNMGSYYLVVLDCSVLGEYTIYHEFSHVIDKRLAWDALIREDALYSDEAWLALLPEGFEYGYSYEGDSDDPEMVQSYVERGDFITTYSMTNPTEDRAELMEGAMCDQTWSFEPGTGCRARMQYYADCIRDCFNTDGWPNTTCWEQVLK